MSGGNPVAQATTWHTLLTKNKLQSNIYAQTSFLKDFTFRSDFGSDLNWNNSDAFMPTFAWGRSINSLNSYKVQTNKSTFWNWRNVLTWQKKIRLHDITIMAGQESQKSDINIVMSSRSKFASNDLYSLNLGDPATAAALQRIEQSNPGILFQPYHLFVRQPVFIYRQYKKRPHVEICTWQTGWCISRCWPCHGRYQMKRFFNPLPSINHLKIRAGFGEVGNQNVPNYVYGSVAQSHNC